MIQEKINSARKALQELGGKVSPEHYAVIREINAELADAADSARRLEGAVIADTFPVCTLNTH